MALKDIKTRLRTVGTGYEIQWNLDQLVGELDSKSKEVADYLLEQSKIDAPVDTGLLRSTGRVEKNDKGEYSVLYGGINGCDYAPYTEFKPGTSCYQWFTRSLQRCINPLSSIWKRFKK